MEDKVIAQSASPALDRAGIMRDDSLRADEAALVAQARHNRAHFTALYHRYLKPVYWYFYQQVGTVQDAEDLTATTFSQALASLDRYEEQGRFAAWLFSIARHHLLAHRRGQARASDELTPSLPIEAEQQPEAQALSLDQLQQLQGQLQTLPAEQREAIALRFLADLRTAEVAQIMGRSEGAVKMLVHRAVTTLRDRLRPEDAR